MAAQRAAHALASLDIETRNRALLAIGAALEDGAEEIFAANRRDMRRAEEAHLAAPLRKRLHFGRTKLEALIAGIQATERLPDPVGRTLEARELDERLVLYRRSVPIGTIGVIFESRPDALVQISTLCLKSANALLLKGGSEARESNTVLARIVAWASIQAGVPENWLQLLTTRADVVELLSCDEYIDLIVPRGSNQFVRHIMDNTTIPVLGHADGVCHLYIDRVANLDMATRIAIDAKIEYVAVCNAIETILIHAMCAARSMPALAVALERAGVTIRGDERVKAMLPQVEAATDEDWATEYLAPIVSIRIVDSLDAAVEHINRYGSRHTDAIVTDDEERAHRFMACVDSASVLHNCSTRFADGYRYGLGAEIGIATGKLHCRGPVGLSGLLTYRWELFGDGHVVADYNGDQARPFQHRELPLEPH